MEDNEKIKQELAAAELYKAMAAQSQQADPRTLENQCCDKCGHTIFEKKYIIKKVIQNSQEFDAPMPVFVCAKCGTIIKSMREDLCIDEYANKPINKPSTLIL